MDQTRRAVMIATAASLTLAGCLGDDERGDSSDDDDAVEPTGDDDSEEPTGDDDSTEADATIEVVSDAFEPAFLAIDLDETVEWRLEDGSHTVTLYHEDNGTQHRAPEDATAFDDDLADETFEHTFETEGVYDYFCRPHEGMGMVGTVVVGEPTEDEPGLSEPDDDLPADALRELNEQTRDEFGLEAADDDGADDDDDEDDDIGY